MDGTDRHGDYSSMLATLRDFRATRLPKDDPSDRALARVAGVAPTTIGDWLKGRRFPKRPDEFIELVRAVKASARARNIAAPDGLLDEEAWREAYKNEAERRNSNVSAAVQRGQAARSLSALSPGRPLAEVTDPFALEVHPSVQAEKQDLPVLPSYIPREHDARLAKIVQAAKDGTSGIAVLVGGSSTGKTRACWEALEILKTPDVPNAPWHLWHPIDPSRPEAALRDLHDIAPHTVIWLNEAQFYLNPQSAALGEQVAAGLRELLRDPDRAPVLILATLWPEYWDRLTIRPGPDESDSHAQARELLAGHDISVPAAFTAMQLEDLSNATDPRLLRAVEAQDGQVTQFLAGVPELLSRYNNAPPPAAALINAAMDARRLGLGIAVPRRFLEAAAPGYLTDAEWNALDENWLDQALSWTTRPGKAARGMLTRLRLRPGTADTGPAYRLADYLDQHGYRTRLSVIPPTEFWKAAEDFAVPDACSPLAIAAEDRGLLRQAARLNQRAAIHGDSRAAVRLAESLRWLHPGDHRPLAWIADNAPISDSSALASLLFALRTSGSAKGLARLLDRGPAALVSLENAWQVTRVLEELWRCNAEEQIAALLTRSPAAHVPLVDPGQVVELAGVLRELGAEEQAAMLDARLAANIAPDDLSTVFKALWAARVNEVPGGAFERLAHEMLAHDPALHFPLSHPNKLTEFTHTLRKLAELSITGADEQVARLLARDPASHVMVSNVSAIADLVRELRKLNASDQVATLLTRCVAEHGDAREPSTVGELLQILLECGAHKQANDLIGRHPAEYVSLQDPEDVIWLLAKLQLAGARDQVGVLLGRCVAKNAVFSDLSQLMLFTKSLRSAEATKHIAMLLACNPAEHVALDDLNCLPILLVDLWALGAARQTMTLADRAAAHCLLDRPSGAGELLKALRRVRADKQATLLLSRLPAEGRFDLFLRESDNKDKYRFGREPDGTPAAPWGWDDLD